jgi:hypothetical protein
MTNAVPKAILLHPDDNILVCVVQIHEGDAVAIDGEPVLIKRDIGVGHKLARRA